MKPFLASLFWSAWVAFGASPYAPYRPPHAQASVVAANVNSPRHRRDTCGAPTEEVVGCGCWGTFFQPQRIPTSWCCSGYSRAIDCPLQPYCGHNEKPWRSVCLR